MILTKDDIKTTLLGYTVCFLHFFDLHETDGFFTQALKNALKNFKIHLEKAVSTYYKLNGNNYKLSHLQGDQLNNLVTIIETSTKLAYQLAEMDEEKADKFIVEYKGLIEKYGI